jgi:O-antigen/teichoic acid export membrane protein
MQKRRIFINAFMSVLQIILVGGVLFFLYKFLLKTIGVEQFGIWSLVLSTTSVIQAANLGLSGSVVKFVAKYVARNELDKVSGVIQTTAISLAVVIGVLLIAGYPLLKIILRYIVPQNSIQLALAILPYAMVSIWLSVITDVFQSGIDGFQKIYIRNILLITGSVFYAILCFLTAPRYGLFGLAYSQIINRVTLSIASWFLLRRILPILPIIPIQWNKTVFKETINYGVNLQAISIAGLFFTPVTKALLSKFGTLSMVGYYEMSLTMILQLRELVLSANRVLVPAIADLQEKNQEKIRYIYLTNYNLLFYLVLPIFTLLIISAPFISQIWIGHYEKQFITFTILLSAGYFLNTLCAPSAISYLGIGVLRWVVVGNLSVALLNFLFGIISGVLFGGYGVIVGWILSSLIGNVIILLSYHKKYKIPYKSLIPKESRVLLFLCIFMIIFVLPIQLSLQSFNNFNTNLCIIVLSLLILTIPFYLHPMRKQLVEWLKESDYKQLISRALL